MNMSLDNTELQKNLQDWRSIIQLASKQGRIEEAAIHAFRLKQMPNSLKSVIEEWSGGYFKTIPQIKFVPQSTIGIENAGAYAGEIQTIFINQDWAMEATGDSLALVMTEELGHHLEQMMGLEDTFGDEGKAFASRLLSTGVNYDSIDNNDIGELIVNNEPLSVEFSTIAAIDRTTVDRLGYDFTATERRSWSAFAVLRRDGSVLAWGEDAAGGDTSSVANQLRGGVVQLFSAQKGMAALKANGGVVSWRNSPDEYFPEHIQKEVSSGVVSISSNYDSFAALREDGSVIAWGTQENGADTTEIAAEIDSDVVKIYSTLYAFAALRNDGTVVSWGHWGDEVKTSSSISLGSSDEDIIKIISNENAFAALTKQGSVISWGADESGGNSSLVGTLLSGGVSDIISTTAGFAALKYDGSMIGWGSSTAVINEGFTSLLPIKNSTRVLARRSNGSFYIWPEPERKDLVDELVGLDIIDAALNTKGLYLLTSDGKAYFEGFWGPYATTGKIFNNVREMEVNRHGYAMLLSHGGVITGGDGASGWSSYGLPNENLNRGVTKIYATATAFAAHKDDGSVITWGSADHGGDSSKVAHLLNNIEAFADPFHDEYLQLNYSGDAPKTPSRPDLVTSSDSGISNADNKTNTILPKFQGLAEENMFIDLYANDIYLGQTVANESGQWEFETAGQGLNGGIYLIQATATDDYGVTSDPSEALQVTIYPSFSSATKASGEIKQTEAIYQATVVDELPVTFSIEQNPEDDWEFFSIQPQTGKVFISEGITLENGRSYALTVSADNTGGGYASQKISYYAHECPDTSPFQLATTAEIQHSSDNSHECFVAGKVDIQYGIHHALEVHDAEVIITKESLNITSGEIYSSFSSQSEPLFDAPLSIDYDSAGEIKFFDNPIDGKRRLAGLPLSYEAFTFKDDGLILQVNEFELPKPLDVFNINGADVIIDKSGLRLGNSGSTQVHIGNSDQLDSNHWASILLRDTLGGLSARYIDTPSPDQSDELKDTLLIQGSAKLDFNHLLKTLGSGVEVGKASLFEWKDLEGIRIQDGQLAFKGSIKPRFFDAGEKAPKPLFTFKGFEFNDFELSLDTTVDPIQVSAATAVSFPFMKYGVRGLGGSFQATYLEEDGFEFNQLSISAETAIPIGNTLLVVTKIGGGFNNLKQSPLEGLANVEIKDASELLRIAYKNAGKQIPDSFSKPVLQFDGEARISSEYFKVSGKGNFLAPEIFSFNGNIDINWEDDYMKIDGGANLFHDFVKLNGNLLLSVSDYLKLSTLATARVRVPENIHWLGSRDLASANIFVQLSDDKKPENDYAMIWEDYNLPFVGKIRKGLKVWNSNDGLDWKSVGLNDIPPVGSWDIDDGTEYFLMTLDAEGALDTPKVQVELPDGRWVVESNFSEYGIALVPELSDTDTTVIIVKNPTPGRWDIEALNPELYGSVTTDAYSLSSELSLDLELIDYQPDNRQITIQANGESTEDESLLEFYLDSDSTGFDGTFIGKQAMTEGGQTTFRFDVGHVPEGNYYLYALRQADSHLPVFQYLEQPLSIEKSQNQSLQLRTLSPQSIKRGEIFNHRLIIDNIGIDPHDDQIDIVLSLPNSVSLLDSSVDPVGSSGGDWEFIISPPGMDSSISIDFIIQSPMIGEGFTLEASLNSTSHGSDRHVTDVSLIDRQSDPSDDDDDESEEIEPKLTIVTESFSEDIETDSAVTKFEIEGVSQVDNLLFNLVAGEGDTDNHLFEVINDQLFLLSPADFEVKSFYDVRVVASYESGGEAATVQQSFELSVIDVDEPPTTTGDIEVIKVNLGDELLLELDQYFTDPDSELSFQAQLENGDELPNWLEFDVEEEEIYGVAPESGIWNIRIYAFDDLNTAEMTITAEVSEKKLIDFTTSTVTVTNSQNIDTPLHAFINNDQPDFDLLLFYDSSLLEFNGIFNTLEGVSLTDYGVESDVNNLDQDIRTDRITRLRIEDLRTDLTDGEQFSYLTNPSFRVKEYSNGNYESVVNIAIEDVSGSKIDIITGLSIVFMGDKPSFNLDVDDDGVITALGDGLMIIRKMFGHAFADDKLTDKAISPDAKRTTEEIHRFIQDGIDAGDLDIDQDSNITALGDGLMIIRHLFGHAFADEALTAKALSPDSLFSSDERPWESVAEQIRTLY